MSYARENGPAVILADATSVFPAVLAQHWRSRGLEVIVVSRDVSQDTRLADGTPVVSSLPFEGRALWKVRQWLGPLLQRFESSVVKAFKRRFRARTGKDEPTPYECRFVNHYFATLPLASAVRAQRPRFVFGQEVAAYGLPTVLCRRIPKILFPWGGDVFNAAESSPFLSGLIRCALRRADLIVPSSFTAAEHIAKRFQVPADKVQPISWGVDLQRFRKADPERRRQICAQWGIDPAATVCLNARRFQPDWGCFTALEAFLRVAASSPKAHFVLLGGAGVEDNVRAARAKVEQAGFAPRFTLIGHDLPLAACSDFMSISDIFLSLMGRGDMRSSSVLQAAAAGGYPIIADAPEYRAMERLGFEATFVNQYHAEEVARAVSDCLLRPERRLSAVAHNQKYLSRYEDKDVQMDRILERIDAVCERYYRPARNGCAL